MQLDKFHRMLEMRHTSATLIQSWVRAYLQKVKYRRALAQVKQKYRLEKYFSSSNRKAKSQYSSKRLNYTSSNQVLVLDPEIEMRRMEREICEIIHNHAISNKDINTKKTSKTKKKSGIKTVNDKQLEAAAKKAKKS